MDSWVDSGSQGQAALRIDKLVLPYCFYSCMSLVGIINMSVINTQIYYDGF